MMMKEWVMIVIPSYTQKVYQLLVLTQCVPRPYHIEGRYGSRTHEYYEPILLNDDDDDDDDDDKNTTNTNNDDNDDDAIITTSTSTTTTTTTTTTTSPTTGAGRRMIGIPVLSKDHVYDAMKINTELYNLFHNINNNDDDDDDIDCEGNDVDDNDNNDYNNKNHPNKSSCSSDNNNNSKLQYLIRNKNTGNISLKNKKKFHKNIYLIYKDYTKSKRAHEPPLFDAQIHIERCPQLLSSLLPSSLSGITTILEYYQSMRYNKNRIFYDNYLQRNYHEQQNQNTTTFTYAELFAGIGGFGIALEALGGKCIFCSEINERCRSIYTTNLLSSSSSSSSQHHHVDDDDSSGSSSSSSIMHGDIYQVSDTVLPKSGTLDILVGGFPCQPFSSLGQQPGLNCPDGNLFLQIVRVLRISQPLAFLLENVPGLLHMTDTINIIIKALTDCGYNVTMEICDARCLTATTRKRLYIVGLLRQRRQQEQQQDTTSESATVSVDTIPATVISNEPFQFPYIPDLGLRARDVIEYDLLDDDENVLRISDEQLHRLNTEKYWKPAHLAWPNTVIDTLVSHYGKSIARGHSQLVPGSAMLLSNNTNSTGSCSTTTSSSSNPRRFTPRECARLMGFPNSYILPPKVDPDQCTMAYYKEWYQMFGNAVCPPIIAAISGAILDRCLTKNHNVVQQQGPQSSKNWNWIEYGRTIAVQLAYDAIIHTVLQQFDNSV